MMYRIRRIRVNNFLSKGVILADRIVRSTVWRAKSFAKEGLISDHASARKAVRRTSSEGASMQQTCPTCGFTTDRPSRFCRQCGAQLNLESEITSAATRNYGAQQVNPTPPGHSGQAPETLRFYQPPQAPQPQGYGAYPISPPPKKSRAAMWIVIALLSLLLVGGSMAGMVILALRSQPVQEAKKASDDFKALIEEAKRAAEEARQLAEEDAQNAGKEIPSPPDAPNAPEPGTASAELETYKYPGAKVRQTARAMGTEVLTLATNDSYDKIMEFYRKQIGAPIAENIQDGERNAVFQSSSSTKVLVTVQTDDQNPAGFKISILRTPFGIPKFN
jgi:hypothetical protein